MAGAIRFVFASVADALLAGVVGVGVFVGDRVGVLVRDSAGVVLALEIGVDAGDGLGLLLLFSKRRNNISKPPDKHKQSKSGRIFDTHPGGLWRTEPTKSESKQTWGDSTH